jgi:uncharacterized damage-inducible protein DinB
MRKSDLLLMELEQESKTTRRVLERLPEDKLGWKPHERSMTAERLAMHVASIPGVVAAAVRPDVHDFYAEPAPPVAQSRAEILEAFEKSLAEAKEMLAQFDDAALERVWTAKRGEQTLTTMPRGIAIRFIMLNHLCHHRGQLSVYLRMLGVPVPAIYGPSADENPWA